MIPIDILLLMTTGAVFPYVACAVVDWAKQRKMHS